MQSKSKGKGKHRLAVAPRSKPIGPFWLAVSRVGSGRALSPELLESPVPGLDYELELLARKVSGDWGGILAYVESTTIARFDSAMPSSVRRDLEKALEQAHAVRRSGRYVSGPPVEIRAGDFGTCILRITLLNKDLEIHKAVRPALDAIEKQQQHELDERRRQRIADIHSLLGSEPSDDFDKEHERATKLLALVRQDIIERITDPLNAAMKARNANDYESKKELAKWANQAARELSLAFATRDGDPAFLAGQSHPHDSEKGRYGLVAYAGAGQSARWKNVQMFTDLVDLKLVPAHLRESRREQDRDTGRG